jgi:hypothetical protein
MQRASEAFFLNFYDSDGNCVEVGNASGRLILATGSKLIKRTQEEPRNVRPSVPNAVNIF